MLSENKMELIRRSIERSYTDSCSITGKKKSFINSVTKFSDVKLADCEPCRISFKTIGANTQTDTSANQVQAVKLFLRPDIVVPPGSRITVKRGSRTMSYKSSGLPAVYETHQEVLLENAEDYA